MFKQRLFLLLALLLVGGMLFLARLYFAQPEPAQAIAGGPMVLDVSGDAFRRFAVEYQLDLHDAGEREQLGYFQSFLEQELLYRQAFAEGMPWQDPVVQSLVLSNQDFLDIDQMTPELLEELVMNDAAIRRHIVRRARHLLSYPDRAEPGRDELREFHAAHPERFQTPARVTLRQFRFATPEAAEQALASALASGNDPAGAQVSSLPSALTAAGHRDLSRHFGAAFADRVFALAATGASGDWQGPLASGLGHHLLQISDYRPAGVAPFDDAILNRVHGQWLNEQRELVYRRRVDAMKREVLVSLNGAKPVPLLDFSADDLRGAL